MKADFGLVKALAPVLRIHPEERYFPMDPLAFLRMSRFRNHHAHLQDKGYNRITRKWEDSNSHRREYYNIPVDVIDSFGLDKHGRNRRPRDRNRSRQFNVFVQPKGKPTGEYRLDAENIPVFYYTCFRTEKAGKRGRGKSEVCSYSQYWWFFGYNDGFLEQNHQGDWEHVTVKVRRGKLDGVWFSAHGQPTYRSSSELQWKGGRYLVYVAKGSHASYHKEGSFHYGTDHTENGGPDFEINSAKSLQNLSIQPWRHFAGAWGEVGLTSATTGPLGPWYKRRNR